jgi:hypothetical protein
MSEDTARIWCGILAIICAAALVRGFLTGKTYFHIAGDRSESPMTYWFLMACWGGILYVAVYRGIVGFPDL